MSRTARVLGLAWLGLVSVGIPAGAAERPIVPGFERFFTGPKTDAAKGGRLLFSELNCVSCHQTNGDVNKKQAPLLDAVGSRVRLGYLRKFLRDPLAIKPGSTMPALFVSDPERDQKVEALVHFLATTGRLVQGKPGDRKSISTGRDFYHKVGCVACHGSRDTAGKPAQVLATSVPLGELTAKYTLAGLTKFLEDPLHSRPSGRMPRLLDDRQARAVAAYLLQGADGTVADGAGTTTYEYYEGSWEQVPDFAKLKPKAAGISTGFDLSVARRRDNYALRFEGWFQIEHEGNYGFTLNSDDGSMLWVDGELVTNNDGIHGLKVQQGQIRLSPGTHRVVVGYFQSGGEAELDVTLMGWGTGRHDLGGLVAATVEGLERQTEAQRANGDALEIRPELAAKGRELFASAGCANCHALKSEGATVASTLSPPSLTQLSLRLGRNGDRHGAGCLSEEACGPLPRYALSARQRQALSAALKSTAVPAKSPADVVAETLVAFNCYACHNRERIGGPEDELNGFFATTQPEMGDEARVPPPLDGVGAKLNADYFKQILDRGSHDRPYMYTRMPGFGAANVGHLVEALAALDKVPSVAPVTFGESLPRVKSVGRHLVGGQAFACIKCHTFAGHKAEGVQGIDMLLLPRRLRHDWFHVYCADPQSMRPGTRMPAAFVQGTSMLPAILDGKAATQLEAIWLYLRDGAKAQLPVGLLKQSLPLVPEKSAIIYRGFIQGAGTRAIAVGYPEKANLAFDANELRLAMLWQGGFLDAARHWLGRGEGYEAPLGDNVLHLHAGVPFAVLARPEQTWPTTRATSQGYKFQGYRLTADDRPTFLYTLGDLHVEDCPIPVLGKDVSLQRTLKLTSQAAPANLFFRAAVGNKIEPLAGQWFRVDGVWKLRITVGSKPLLRQSAGRTELLVPVSLTNGKAEITEHFMW